MQQMSAYFRHTLYGTTYYACNATNVKNFFFKHARQREKTAATSTASTTSLSQNILGQTWDKLGTKPADVIRFRLFGIHYCGISTTLRYRLTHEQTRHSLYPAGISLCCVRRRLRQACDSGHLITRSHFISVTLGPLSVRAAA